MVQPKRVEAEPVQPAVFASLLTLADERCAPLDSPARRLQLDLEASFAEPAVRRWPGAARVALILGASVALWAGIITGAAAVLS